MNKASSKAPASGAHAGGTGDPDGGKGAKAAKVARRSQPFAQANQVRRGSAGAKRRESKSHPRRKTAQRRRAGGAVALDSGAGKAGLESQAQYRKLDEMGKLAYIQKNAVPEPRPVAVPAESIRELVAPHEWDALLNAFEEGGVAPASQPAADAQKSVPGEIGIESEDLWERLSSTRWLKELDQPGKDNSEDPSNKSTVANR